MGISPLVAVLDACVLYPMYLRDTLLRAAEAELFTVRWSAAILDEVRCNLVAGGHVSDAQARRLTTLMTEAFPAAAVTGYEQLVPDMLNHPKDRHVTAAAVACNAEVIVTDNLKDFPRSALEPFALDVQSADSFLMSLFSIDGDVMVDVIVSQARDYAAPPLNVAELLSRLATHAPTFAKQVRDRGGAQR